MSWQLVIVMTVKIAAGVLLVLLGGNQPLVHALAGVLLGASGVTAGVGVQAARASKGPADKPWQPPVRS